MPCLSCVDVSVREPKALLCLNSADVSGAVAKALPCHSSALSNKRTGRPQLRFAVS